jgi:hypothetical protein
MRSLGCSPSCVPEPSQSFASRRRLTVATAVGTVGRFDVAEGISVRAPNERYVRCQRTSEILAHARST